MLETFEFEYLLVGDLSPSDLRDISDGIESIGDLDSVEIRYSVSPSADEKAAMIFGKMKQQSALSRVEDFLRQRAMQSGFILISGLGE